MNAALLIAVMIIGYWDFFYDGAIIVLMNGFVKKSQKTPRKEIALCKQRMKDFIARGGK